MSTQSSMLHVRIDSELKQKATETLAAMGLSASDAVRLLFSPDRGRSGLPPRTQGSQRANPKGHGRVGRNDEAGQSAIRKRERDVYGT